MCIAVGIGAAAIGAGGAIASGLIQGQAAQSAAQTQAQAAANAQNISLQEFNTITGQQQPFMNAGYGALSSLEYGLGIGGSPGGFPAARGRGFGTPGTAGAGPGYGSLVTPFTTANWQQLSPQYNFTKQQGIQGVLGGDAASQGALSGAAAKDLIGYNQNLANTSFGQAFNQYQTQQGNIFNRLASIAQLGQNAAANVGAQGTTLAGQQAQSATNIGTALGAGQIGQANAYSGALSSAVPWLYAGGGSAAQPFNPTIGGVTPAQASAELPFFSQEIAPVVS
jgi:hypothetical protein